MSLKQYLFIMTCATLVSYLVFASVLNFFDPFVAGKGVIFLFYISLAMALIGTFSILGYILRHFFAPAKIAFRDVMTSFRQGVLLTVLVLVSLFLKQVHLFNLLSVVLLIVTLTSLEMYILTTKQIHR